jgi:hypothetical protein
MVTSFHVVFGEKVINLFTGDIDKFEIRASVVIVIDCHPEIKNPIGINRRTRRNDRIPL